MLEANSLRKQLSTRQNWKTNTEQPYKIGWQQWADMYNHYRLNLGNL